MDNTDGLSQLASQQNLSGELCDISIPTANNQFGYYHIMGNIKYGVWQPIHKYKDELQMILDSETDTQGGDDKSDKRRLRLQFLNYCETSMEIDEIFPAFTSMLNGGGARGLDFGDYPGQNLICTAAGGNIITLFAQVLLNMVDWYIWSVGLIQDWNEPDKPIDPVPYFAVAGDEGWDVINEEYEPAGDAPDDRWRGRPGVRDWTYRKIYQAPDFQSLPRSWKKTLTNGYDNLTSSAQKLIEYKANAEGILAEPEPSYYDNVLLWMKICQHILFEDLGRFGYDESFHRTIIKIATGWLSQDYRISPISDFDFKIGPNQEPSLIGQHNGYDFDSDGSEADRIISRMNHLLTDQRNVKAGFLLVRAKTLITCYSQGANRLNYSSKDLKEMRRDCTQNQGLGSWVYSLFPQTMQASYFHGVDEDSDCYRFLQYLMDKKKTIGLATKNNIDEILKFYLSGAYQLVNPDDQSITVEPSENSTEAIITYIKNTTHYLNRFIAGWLNGKLRDGKGLNLQIAGENLGPPPKTTYQQMCDYFLNTDNLMFGYRNNYLIPRLSADLMSFFLNMPVFNTENILDSLIKRMREASDDEDCIMPTSDVIVAPVSRDLVLRRNPNGRGNLMSPLAVIKRAIDDMSFNYKGDYYSGLPDGVRVTINALESEIFVPESDTITEFYIPEDRLDEIEESVLDELLKNQFDERGNTNIITDYIPTGKRKYSRQRSHSSSRSRGHSGRGGYKKTHKKHQKYKKNKTHKKNKKYRTTRKRLKKNKKSIKRKTKKNSHQ